MKKGIKHIRLFWLIPCSYGWHNLYSGQGYLQGMGFDFMYKALTIGKIKIITDIYLDVKGEWLRNLKKRWEEDEAQQKYEISS